MVYLVSEKQQNQYYFKVNMDESKGDDSYIREFTWPLSIPDVVQTETEYLAKIKREIGLLVEAELLQMNQTEPESTPLEGF